MIDVIGWTSSLILISTIGKQIHKQWHDHTSVGVSVWLFVGQLAASTGFTIYSLLLRNWVFSVTNGILLLSALLGYGITIRHRRAAARHPHDGV